MNIQLGIKAIRLREFQDFMKNEMKLSDDEIKKMMSCQACWGNFKFTPRSIEKINRKLNEMKEAGKISEPKKYKTERLTTKEQALAFIETLSFDSDIFISF